MNVKHILFPVDFSSHSRGLNIEVEWLASQFDARVTLLHVVEVPAAWYGPGEPAFTNTQFFFDYLKSEEERLREYRINLPENRLRRVTEEGSAAFHISDFAKDNDVDLIVMGTHGYGPIRRFLLGSVALKTLHDVTCPVWIDPNPGLVPIGEKRQIASIVCSIELSPEAVPLLCYAKDLASHFGARVHLIHSIPEAASRPAKYFDSDFHGSLKKAAIEEIAQYQAKAKTDYPLSITEGFVAEDIVDVVQDRHAELLLIGRGLVQAHLGTWRTHTSEILRKTCCPVLSFCYAGASVKDRSYADQHVQVVG